MIGIKNEDCLDGYKSQFFRIFRNTYTIYLILIRFIPHNIVCLIEAYRISNYKEISHLLCQGFASSNIGTRYLRNKSTFAPISVPSLAPPFALPPVISKSLIEFNLPDLLAKMGFS